MVARAPHGRSARKSRRAKRLAALCGTGGSGQQIGRAAAAAKRVLRWGKTQRGTAEREPRSATICRIDIALITFFLIIRQFSCLADEYARSSAIIFHKSHIFAQRAAYLCRARRGRGRPYLCGHNRGARRAFMAVRALLWPVWAGLRGYLSRALAADERCGLARRTMRRPPALTSPVEHPLTAGKTKSAFGELRLSIPPISFAPYSRFT